MTRMEGSYDPLQAEMVRAVRGNLAASVLAVCRAVWDIRLESRLDQPAQRNTGLFPPAVL